MMSGSEFIWAILTTRQYFYKKVSCSTMPCSLRPTRPSHVYWWKQAMFLFGKYAAPGRTKMWRGQIFTCTGRFLLCLARRKKPMCWLTCRSQISMSPDFVEKNVFIAMSVSNYIQGFSNGPPSLGIVWSLHYFSILRGCPCWCMHTIRSTRAEIQARFTKLMMLTWSGRTIIRDDGNKAQIL